MRLIKMILLSLTLLIQTWACLRRDFIRIIEIHPTDILASNETIYTMGFNNSVKKHRISIKKNLPDKVLIDFLFHKDQVYMRQ